MSDAHAALCRGNHSLHPPPAILESLAAMRAPVVIGHVVPDADALGAMFALALSFSSANIAPKVSLPPGSLSQKLTFLLDWAQTPIASAMDFKSADGFIVVDTAKKGRCNVGPLLKDSDWSQGRPLVNIDHHETNTRFGEFNWVVERAGSTCELTYHLLRALDRPINPIIASLLYAGIQTDTLGFSLPTTGASALRACADLVDFGADVGDLGERLSRSLRPSEFHLLRIVYANTQITADGRLAYSSLSHQEIVDAGCFAADIDDQIGVPRSLHGVQLAMLFSEGNKGKTRVNFRGSGPVTVLSLAAEFRGGGHLQSAGAILDCGLRDALGMIIPRAVEYLNGIPAYEAAGS